VDSRIAVLAVLGVAFIVSISLAFLLYQENNYLSKEVNGFKGIVEENNSLKLDLVKASEAKIFAEKQVLVQRQDLNALRSVYSDLWTDATSCYWANYCLYYEDSCLNVLGDLWEGYTAEEIHIANSDYCESMSRDWERYQSFDVTLKGD
jgi:hypothetical protein